MDERARNSILASIVRSACMLRGFTAVVACDAHGQPVIAPTLGEALAGLPVAITRVPELDPLLERLPDAIVLFNPSPLMIGVRVIRWPSTDSSVGGWRPASTLDEALELGRSLLGYTGSINGARMPVSIELVDVFDGDLPVDALAGLAGLRKIGHGLGGDAARVNVSLSLLDAEHGVARSNAQGLSRRRFESQLRHAWELRGQGAAHWQTLIAQAGVRPKSVALGVLVGGVVEVAALFALLELGARDGMIYGGVMAIASIVGAVVAIRPGQLRPRSAAHVEALIGGLGALAIGLACWIALGGSIGLGTVTVVLSAAVVCGLLGSVSNTTVLK